VFPKGYKVLGSKTTYTIVSVCLSPLLLLLHGNSSPAAASPFPACMDCRNSACDVLYLGSKLEL